MTSRFKQFINSISFALAGLRQVLKEEQNFKFQLGIALLVLVFMFLLDLSSIERAILTLAIAFVLVLELMNSIFERVVDLLKPRVHLQVKRVKDIMAGTVFIASVAVVIVGLLIVWPHISFNLLS